jgi:hypothetical protein
MQVGSPSASYWEHQTGHCQPDFTSYDANWQPSSPPVACFEDGPNTYDYVGQNPWTKFDPEGLSSGDDIAGGLLDGVTSECVNQARLVNAMQDPATGYVVGQELNKVDQATRAGSADVNKDLGADKNSSAYQITKILSSAAVQIGLLFAGGEAAKAEQAMEQTLAPAITKAEQDLAPALQLTEEAKTAAAEVKPSPPAPGAPASAKSAPTGQSYSVAFQTELKPTSYPGLSSDLTHTN